LRRVVDFEAIPLKVPQEVPGKQAVCTRFTLLRVCWCHGCLLLDVVVNLPSVAWLLTCNWDSCSEFLLPTNSSSSVGVLALLAWFICFSILWWYVHRDDQELAI
jgi:hypothetical protein